MMPNTDAALATLTAKLENVEKNQDEAREFNMRMNTNLMEKLGILAKIETTVAVMARDISHLTSSYLDHVKLDEKLTERVVDLEGKSYITKGALMAIGTISAFVGAAIDAMIGLVHR